MSIPRRAKTNPTRVDSPTTRMSTGRIIEAPPPTAAPLTAAISA